MDCEYPITCPTLPDISEIADEMRGIFASGQITSGPHVAVFEDEVRSRLGVRHAIAVSSGTSALILLIRALSLPEGSEVIVPSFTFAATCHALLWNRLRPVFCDSRPEDLTVDAAAAEALITPRTSALLPVCIAGVPGELDAYQRLADRYGLALIFDSAQGMGATYRGQPVGGFGAGEVFSLSPTKVVTAMEGGLVTTNSDELAETIRRMRDYGKSPDGEDMTHLGLSARMPEVNAVIGRWSLARMDTWIEARRAIMDRYDERLSMMPGLSFQQIPRDRSSSRNYVVVLLDPLESPVTRDEMHARLASRGVRTRRFFCPALHNQTVYRDADPGCGQRLTVAERISSQSLSLPMYSHMPLDAVDRICDLVIEIGKTPARRW